MDKKQILILAYGLMLLGVFLWTGQYLENEFRPKNLEDIGLRMGARASHIYILMVSQVIILSSFFKDPIHSKTLNILFNTGRGILAVSGLIFVISFFKEHDIPMDERHIVLWGCITTILGVALMGVKTLEK